MALGAKDKRYIDPVHDSEEIRTALGRVLNSDLFAHSERLKDFLSYVVEEAIAGRANEILGKKIAEDVYQRNIADEGSTSIVRVDAGRLRRKLTSYYETEGAKDAVRIQLESVGYAPTFIDHDPNSPAALNVSVAGEGNFGRSGKLTMVGTIIVAIMLLAGSVFWITTDSDDPPKQNDARLVERQALASKSKATVQADNLCVQARGMLFPIVDRPNQSIATDIFKQAIIADPGYSCGYSGAAHSLSTMALLTLDESERKRLAADAGMMAEKSLNVAPKDGWSQSAIAWSAFVNRQFDLALEHSALAANLSPADGNVLDFRALILLLTGDFKTAMEISDPKISRETGSFRFANRNIHAVANYHLGNYDTAIASLNAATELGDPVSALTLAYLAASYHGLRREQEARRLIRQLQENWPNFRPELLYAFYTKPELVDGILTALNDAGWNKSEN